MTARTPTARRTVIQTQRGHRLQTSRFEDEPTVVDPSTEDRALQLVELPIDHEPNAPRALRHAIEDHRHRWAA
jgi:hypothetical protein